MGKLIVIEGLDGSGKETQSNLIFNKLKTDGYKVMKISYPRYNKESSALVKMYLRGDFGKDAEMVTPYISSTFYAVDRYASFKTEYEQFYNDGGIIIADRYTTSNMVHQGGKITDTNELDEFLDWLWELEFKTYKIPIPDKVFYLDIPVEYSIERIRIRKNKIDNKDEKDIHENNNNHLLKSYTNALKLVKRYNWDKIECQTNNELRTIEDINREIYLKLEKILKGERKIV